MKKVLNVLGKVIVSLVVIFTIGVVGFTIVSVNTFNRSDRSLFGYHAFIVLSDSMSKTDFSAGDLALVKAVDPTTLKEGDIIAYVSQNKENYGEVVTHKIRSLTQDEQGNPGFITYGTTTDTDDPIIVTYSDILGKYQRHIPKVGRFFMFLKTVPGYICCIFVPFLVLILLMGLNCIKLFKQYKKEQYAEIQAERDKIEAERLESQKLMAELKELRNQLADKEKPIENQNEVPQH